MKKIKLARGDRIVAVVPEHCSGPGWRNSVVWVYVVCPDATVREIGLQYDEISPDMRALFDVGVVVCTELKRAVPCVVDGQAVSEYEHLLEFDKVEKAFAAGYAAAVKDGAPGNSTVRSHP